MDDVEAIAWVNAKDEDLWIFDKLIVARKLGHTCGPVGVDVTKPGTYIVRPCVNIPGMGRGAEFVYLQDRTNHLPAGHFWCERFTGRHISVDYKNGQQVLAVEGHRNEGSPLWRFSMWRKVDDVIPLPSIFFPLIKRYEYINIEFIDGHPIEVHLRGNPDFVHGNSIAIPVWNDFVHGNSIVIPVWNNEHITIPDNLRYIEAPDYQRKGFYID